jgi:hypothetical protein
MKCEILQFNLPLYADGALTDGERELTDAHLERCPLCRARLSEFQSLQNDLRALSPAEAPAGLLNSVRNRVAIELRQSKREPYFYTAGFREWLQYRLMPYSVGTIASLVLTFAFLLTLLSTREATQRSVESAQMESNRRVVLMASNSNPKIDEIISTDYSALNLPIADESPRINPTGALLALTKSIVRGKMKDEDVVVVADVFGNGIARIAEVVEAPRDRRAMLDLERALNEDPSFAPFVPANQDNRSDHVRVILKIQRVDVVDKTPRPKTKSRAL